MRLWDFASRKERLSLPRDQELKVEGGKPLRQESRVMSVAFSPDGRWLLAGYSRNFKGESYALLWDVWTGEKAGRFVGHGGTVTSVAFAPGGKTCATGSQDTTALVWDVAARLRQRKPRRLDLTAATREFLEAKADDYPVLRKYLAAWRDWEG